MLKLHVLKQKKLTLPWLITFEYLQQTDYQQVV